MGYQLNKDKVKNELTIEQIHELVAELGGEPRPISNGMFVSQTICHNHLGEGSHKLYYYDNTKLFRCYTECEDTFDIFELVCKVKNLAEEFKSTYTKEGLVLRKWELYDAVEFVALYFNLIDECSNFESFDLKTKLKDWEVFERYEEKEILKGQQNSLRVYDSNILTFLPKPTIVDWENEEIKKEVMDNHNICYNPRNAGIVIPHYDINGNLVGIRERTLVKENEQYGKYKPAILNGKMYNHPLGFNLYNLNMSKNNIKLIKKAIIFESEKSCLKYASYFGEENDITVACCGQTITSFQLELLSKIGVEEIIIAFDREGEKDNKKQYVQKFYNYQKKYGALYNLSFIYDKEEKYLDYKSAPIDHGKETFLKLFKERIYL
jgi:hypothetical protein